MRKAYLVDVFNMIENLKIKSTQTKYVVKTYKSVYKNRYETISMDVQMQSMCRRIYERFNIKLKNANLSNLATYWYLYIIFS